MEKLIELLNEYDVEDEWCLVRMEGRVRKIDERLIISKSYGFIKRLVSNEQRRIDRSKVNFKNIFYEYDGDITNEEKILILLSIQEEPVSFLISLLK